MKLKLNFAGQVNSTNWSGTGLDSRGNRAYEGIDPWSAVIHCNTFVMNEVESVRAGYKVGDIDYLALFNGKGNGTPLQYSCLENPMDGGAWCTAVHGVAKSWTLLSDFIFTFHLHVLKKWQPTPVFLPGESQGWGSLVGCHLWGRTESDTTEAT